MEVNFPSDFLWGASLSSYQCEGSNYNTDWYIWEKERGIENAGYACRHYSLFKEDFRLASQTGLNSLRISLEWARIYPEESRVSEDELNHYEKVIDTLISLGMEPVVTLHHFTNPLWFAERKGWMHPQNIDLFLKYVNKVVNRFRSKVKYWVVFNEPLVYIYYGFIEGIWPPGKKSLPLAYKSLRNILDACVLAYQEIKRIYGQDSGLCRVSIAKHVKEFEPCPYNNFGQNWFSACMVSKIFNFSSIDYLLRKRCLDFLGVNYYSKGYVRHKGLIGCECRHNSHKERKNAMGWHVCPEGFYRSLKRLKRFCLPVIITENGTAESQEHLYLNYLTSHLKSMARAYSEGINIKGYYWWSLMDNFEWDKGFCPKFGLYEVNFSTMERKMRAFAGEYSRICKTRRIDITNG
ncbi:MAG: family 1 glycosylhydrolase [Candidatus Omnitrophota bacterium]